MKNKYNWEQVADVYNQELGINYPYMKEYLKEIYSDNININTLEEHENHIKELIKINNPNHSEYFLHLYI